MSVAQAAEAIRPGRLAVVTGAASGIGLAAARSAEQVVDPRVGWDWAGDVYMPHPTVQRHLGHR